MVTRSESQAQIPTGPPVYEGFDKSPFSYCSEYSIPPVTPPITMPLPV
jgi:hypothetical protein